MGNFRRTKIAKEQVIPAMKKSKNTELYAIASRDISKAEDFCHKFAIQKLMMIITN